MPPGEVPKFSLLGRLIQSFSVGMETRRMARPGPEGAMSWTLSWLVVGESEFRPFWRPFWRLEGLIGDIGFGNGF